jgi:hypothetical protein
MTNDRLDVLLRSIFACKSIEDLSRAQQRIDSANLTDAQRAKAEDAMAGAREAIAKLARTP